MPDYKLIKDRLGYLCISIHHKSINILVKAKITNNSMKLLKTQGLDFFKTTCLFLTLSMLHATIVTISHLAEKVPLQELVHATEFRMKLV